jgi:fatty acid CoA ligase FadD9
MTIDSLDDTQFRELGGGQEARVTRRAAELFDSDAQFRAAAPVPEVIAAACTPGLRLTEVFETLVEGYADRPALGQRARELVTDAATGRTSVRLLPRFDTISYREFWARVRAIASAWRHDLAHPAMVGDVVATIGFASADYLVIDMVCAYLGLVTVPLQHNAPASRLRPIIEECEPRIVAVSADYLDLAVESVLSSPSVGQVMVFDYQPEVDEQRENFERARARLHEAAGQVVVITVDEVVEHGSRLPVEPAYADGSGERLAMILYTSGSTGAPKGAMYTEAMVAKHWTGLYLSPGVPTFNVNFMPMNHLGGRVPLASAFIAGGTSYFVPKSDLSTLFDDWALVRPTQMVLVPRVVDMLFQHNRIGIDRRIAEGADPTNAERAAAAELRELVGGRVLGGAIGTAPLAAQMKAFVDSALDVHVADGYGLTETGTISLDGVINRERVQDYKLIDVPELGYFRTDRPHPRGELLIKADTVTPGYYKRPELTAAMFDADGYYRTGDVMAEIMPDRLVYVDRRSNVLKLANGEFVATTNLEGVYRAAPLVRQIFVYGNSERSKLLAVVVPTLDALKEFGDDRDGMRTALHKSLKQCAAAAQLQSYEVPVDFVIATEPFTEENGLLSGVGKLLRPRLTERYGERLEQMYTETAVAQVNEVRALRETAADRPVVETLTTAIRALLGSAGADAEPDAHFTDLGGDSLSALTFSNLLKDIFGVDVPVGVIISPTSSVGILADYIKTQRSTGAQRPTCSSVHGHNPTVVLAGELTLDKFIDAETLSTARSLPRFTGVHAPHTVLLTGANGWLGRFLTLEWLERLSRRGGKLIAIVRGRDADEARTRIEDAFDSGDPALLSRFRLLAANHLEVIPGDIGDRDLGMDVETWQRLAASIDLIVHPAALVNHVLPYGQLFGPNVVGTAELIRLAISTRIKPITYVSTMAVAQTVPPGQFEEDGDIRRVSPIRPINDDYANGYANSKWAGEVLLRQANDLCGVPVAVFRSDMILAHTRYRGQLNVSDMFTRLIFSLLVTGIAPQSFYESDGVGCQARAHFDGLSVDFVAAAITMIGTRVTAGYRSFDVMNPHDDGVSLDVFVDWLIQAGNDIRRITDYDEWLSRLQVALAGLPEPQRQQSVLPLLDAFRKPDKPIRGAAAPTDAFQAEVLAVRAGPDKDIPHISAELIAKYASDLRQLGLLS